jgi:Rieske [2Fe-2S] domain
MRIFDQLDRLEQADGLDRLVTPGQRVARSLPPGRLRDALHGVWCSHLSAPLSDGEFADGCVTCPWHGSMFRLADGSVARGPATAPQPTFRTRVRDGILQVCLPGAG